MIVLIPNGRQRHPACVRSEVRAYSNPTNARRARAHLERQGNRVVAYLDVAGPALFITRYVDEREDQP
jgi:hypothetical protein